MKLSHYPFAALSLALILTGCATDDVFNSTVDDSSDVTFSISLADANLSSRAADHDNAIWTPTYQGDADVDIVYIQAYDSDDNTVFVNPKTLTLTEGKATATLSLPNSSTYTIVFWAQNSSCTAYDLTGFPDIKVKYPEGQINNDPSLTAFYATVNDIHPTLLGSLTVTLRRAVAQVNVGMPYASYEALDANKRPKFSSVTFTGLPDSFNLLSGTTTISDADAKTTFAISEDITSEKGTKLQITEDGVESSYAWLSMSYVFAPSDVHVVTDATFTFQTADKATDNASVFSQKLTVKNVPVTQNYRTNILAGLSDDVTFDIVTDYSWVSDNTAIRLLDAGTFANLVNSDGIADFGKDDVIVDLEGSTIAAPTKGDENETPVHIYCRNFTIKNGTIKKGAIWLTNSGETYISDMKFEGKAGYIASHIFIGYGTGESATDREYSPKIVLDNVDFSGVSADDSSYNLFIDGGDTPNDAISGKGTEQIFISYCKFANSVSDAVRIIGVSNSASINISECSFVLPYQDNTFLKLPGNGVKFTNMSNATNVKVNVANCLFKYAQDGVTDFASSANYAAGIVGLAPTYTLETYYSMSTWNIGFFNIKSGDATSSVEIESINHDATSLLGLESGNALSMYPTSINLNSSNLTFDTSSYPEGYFK